MKENTAAVHAQVPVDVATFLLNEKRAEIHAIEARLKVERGADPQHRTWRRPTTRSSACATTS